MARFVEGSFDFACPDYPILLLEASNITFDLAYNPVDFIRRQLLMRGGRDYFRKYMLSHLVIVYNRGNYYILKDRMNGGCGIVTREVMFNSLIEHSIIAGTII